MTDEALDEGHKDEQWLLNSLHSSNSYSVSDDMNGEFQHIDVASW